MTALYEIANEYKTALSVLNDSDFDEETIADTLEGMSGEFNDKAINVASFTKNLDAESNAIAEAIKQMQARKKSLDNKSERVKDYLKESMEQSGITDISCPYFQLKIQKNPPSVVIDIEENVPDEFKTEKTVISIDKAAIKKAGGCDGATIEQKTRLVIK